MEKKLLQSKMSAKNSNSTVSSASSSRSATPPPVASSSAPVFPLKHRHSFEERYAAIINQQILENTINREVLQRQVQAFFPFSRTTSRECTEEGKNEGNKETVSGEEKAEELNRKILEKLETLDIKDKEET